MSQSYIFHVPRLCPQFIITQHGDAWTVEAFVQTDLAYASPTSGWIYNEDDTPSVSYLVSGPAADLLFLCLTGHRFGTPGSQADPQITWQARARLQAIAPTPGGYWLAHCVVMHWGADVWPEMRREKRMLWRL